MSTTASSGGRVTGDTKTKLRQAPTNMTATGIRPLEHLCRSRGVSRSGKTPTCLYLAMQFGIRAANYPITEEDLHTSQLPDPIAPYRDRVYGLTIDAKRLASIREERRPASRYASIEQCRAEVRKVESLFKTFQIPFINSTNTSVEEISTRVVQTRGLDRHSVL